MKTLLVDNQLPVALSRFLSAKGFESVHVMDLAMAESSDRDIWRYAIGQNCVVVSKDEDFVHLAHADPQAAQLVWVRLGNCRKAHLLTVFEKLLPDLCEALESGQQVIEIQE